LSAEKSKRSAGWVAGALVFWLLSAWLITVGLSSIIPQIFSPAGEPEADAASCGPVLRDLRDELLAHVSRSFAAPEASREATREWFDTWDLRLFRARPSCTEPEQGAWTELNRLLHGLAALTERFERDERPHLQRLDQLLGAPAAAHVLEPMRSTARATPLEDHSP
jgi:hypothetical protein